MYAMQGGFNVSCLITLSCSAVTSYYAVQGGSTSVVMSSEYQQDY